MGNPYRFRPIRAIKYYALRGLRRQLDKERAKVRARTADLQHGLVTCTGYLTLHWAFMENHLDLAIERLHAYGGQEVQTDLPVSMKAKLVYLKRTQSAGILPLHLHDEADAVRAEIKRLGILRSDLVHGIASTFDPSNVGWKISRFTFTGPIRGTQETPYRDVEIYDGLQEMSALCDRVSSFRQHIWDHFNSENASNLEG